MQVLFTSAYFLVDGHMEAHIVPLIYSAAEQLDEQMYVEVLTIIVWYEHLIEGAEPLSSQ